MSTLLEALAKAGLVTPDKAKEESDYKVFRSTVKDLMDGPFKRRTLSKYKPRDIRDALADQRRNPSVSGSMPSENRLRDAAGSDSGKLYRVSGPATQFGMPGRSTKVSR